MYVGFLNLLDLQKKVKKSYFMIKKALTQTNYFI